MKFYGKNNYSSQAMVTRKQTYRFPFDFSEDESKLVRDTSATILGVVFCNYHLLVWLFIRYLLLLLSTGDALSYVIVFNKPKYR